MQVLLGAGFSRDEAARADRALFVYTFGFAAFSSPDDPEETRRRTRAALAGLPSTSTRSSRGRSTRRRKPGPGPPVRDWPEADLRRPGGGARRGHRRPASLAREAGPPPLPLPWSAGGGPASLVARGRTRATYIFAGLALVPPLAISGETDRQRLGSLSEPLPRRRAKRVSWPGAVAVARSHDAWLGRVARRARVPG